jgi:LuxR family maltose regulon positive regulatory protein
MLRRARLLQTLNDNSTAPLTTVTAPAGYGKTLLLLTWCNEQDGAIAWITLDSNDDDPVRLWTHVAAAVSRASRGLGGGALERLDNPAVAVEPAIDSLLSAIAAHEGPVAVVLDDLDTIESEESLGSIEYAFTRLPMNARMLVTARSDPPFTLAKLRTEQLLTEIRSHELAFTEAEAHELLVRTEGIALSEDSVRLLVDRTEGWPAALYLAVLWLRDRAQPDDAARTFGASNRQVADYLTEEVLESLDGETKRFLARTAVLGRFTPELCDAVLERDDCRTRLAELERSNLLLISLEGEGNWYRYHHLFAELLRLELRETNGDVLPDRAAVHGRAASWCRERGLVEDAVEHAWEAGDLELVADLLLEAERELAWSGRVAFLQAWVERLPPEVLVARPALPAGAALAAMVRARPLVEIARLVSLAEQGRGEHPEAWDASAEIYIALARSVALDSDDAGASVDHARKAVHAVRTNVEPLIVPALGALARALFFVGDLVGAREAALEAVTRPEAEQRPHGYVTSLGILSLVEAEEGRPQHASALARQALDYARTHGHSKVWFAAFAHVGLSAALNQIGRHDAAEREAVKGEELWRRSQASLGHAYALLRLADARIARARFRQAADVLDEARREIAEFPDPGRLPELASVIESKLAAVPSVVNEPVEDPSPGELAVLRYLPSDLSQREIAARLYISLNTLRTHLRALYRKLGVHTREAAVARADAVGLLDGTDLEGDHQHPTSKSSG